jgi:hypothetical protein
MSGSRRRRRFITGLVGAAVIVAAVAGGALGGGVAAADEPSFSDVGGTLTTPGSLTGIARITFDLSGAADATYDASISVDGNVISTDPVSPPLVNLGLDTSAFVDGSHDVTVTLSDAGGDAPLTVWSGQIDTLNAPQGGPPLIVGQAVLGDTMVAVAGPWSPPAGSYRYQWLRCDSNGCTAIDGATQGSYTLAGADVGKRIAVKVTAVDSDGSSSSTSAPSAVVLAAASDPGGGDSNEPPASANGSGGCDAPTLIAAINGGATARIASGVVSSLRGSIECAGTPVSGATLELTLTPRAGAGPVVHTEIVSGADGSFSYLVPAGCSRTVAVSYSAVVGGAVAASAAVKVLVTPALTLSITPTHTSNGHTITFRGRVGGGYIPRGGLPVEIEYRQGSTWMIYTLVKAHGASGSFVFRYTFERTTQTIVYSFRVATPVSGVPGYPYEPAASPVRSVHVAP